MSRMDEILAKPRPVQVCSRCEEPCVRWRWVGIDEVNCEECLKRWEAFDERERKRMMGQLGRKD